MSIFIKQLGGMVPSLGRQIHYNSKKAQDIFNWKYISAEDSAIESAKQLESMGLLPQLCLIHKWKKENFTELLGRMTGWQLDSFKESYEHKIKTGISIFKKNQIKK